MANFANYLVLLGIILGGVPMFFLGRFIGRKQSEKKEGA
jgi:uncharacterized membrane protein YdjX (TVP38/TMEM64 family)